MTQIQKNRLLKPLGFILAGLFSFVPALVGYILTAIDSYYDDGFGLSISYGSKDLLMLTIISFLVIVYGLYLLINSLQNKKEIPYLSSIFTGFISFLILVFFLSYIFKPIIKGKVEIDLPYIMMIVCSFLGVISTVLASILAYRVLKKKENDSSYIFVSIIAICHCLAISLYAISKGISLNGNGIAICYFILVGGQVIELLISILDLNIAKLR